MIDRDKLIAAVDRATDGLSGAAIWLFGSEAAGKARSDSDVDIAILAARPLDSIELLSLRDDLALQLSRDVDVVDLRTASPLLAVQAVRNGIVLVDRDRTARHLFVASLLSRRYDLLRIRRDAERALIRRMGVG